MFRTHIAHSKSTKHTPLSTLFALCGGFVLLFPSSGCGGSKTNSNSYGGISAATPASYGLEAYNAVIAADSTYYLQVSGLEAAPAGSGTAFVTGAVDSTATALPNLGISTSPSTGNATIPLGFAPGGQFIDSKNYGAVTVGASVVFRAALSNGQNGTTVIPIDPSKVILTSPEIAGFTQALSFNQSLNSGPLANALYTTPTFTLPFTTTGLHKFVISVGDTAGQSSTTTYAVPVLTSGNAGVLAEVVNSSGTPVPGATATITSPVSGAATQATADSQGVVILFSAPGAQTITATLPATAPSAAETGTANVTLAAGQLLDTEPGTSPATPLTVTLVASGM